MESCIGMMENKRYLDIHGIIRLPIIPGIPIEPRTCIQRHQSTVNHQPSVSPCETRVLFNPFLGCFFLPAIWPVQSGTTEFLSADGNHHTLRDAVNSAISNSSPQSHLQCTGSISKMAEAIECNCELLTDRVLLIL